MADQCDNCRYYRLRTYGTDPDTKQVGECRYSDPQGQTGYWPQVKADDWCGKWEAIPVPLEQRERMLVEVPS
jgi:hypothetical protein